MVADGLPTGSTSNRMKMPRWTAVSQSAFAWERDALDFARGHLPDHDPWRAWSNFKFIDDEGRVNEVDLLVLTPAGLVLIEIKSRPGTVKADAQSWTWSTDGRQVTTDNPLTLANRKAKRLSSILRRQEALGGGGAPRRPAPWVEPLNISVRYPSVSGD
jgi:Nuclease-related domain